MNFFIRLRREFKTLLYRQEKLNQQIDYSIQKINDIDQQFDLINQKIDILIQKIDSVDQRVNIIPSQINSIIQRTDTLSQQIITVNRTLNMHHRENKIMKKEQKIKIVFLIHNLNAWYSIFSVYQKLCNTDQVEVIVASINKNFPGQMGYSGEDKVHQFLDDIQVSHIRLSMEDSFQGLDIIKSIAPDIIFRQSQWDNDYPPAFSSENLDFARLVFISYEILNLIENVQIGNNIIDSAVDSLFHRRCWRIYVANQNILRQATHNGHLNAAQFRIKGHPKVDYIASVLGNWPFNDKANKRILWSPHHSITNTWSNFGCFHLAWHDMLVWFKEQSSVDFVFCPHPALLTMLTSDQINSIISRKEIDYFFEKINELENVYIYTSYDYINIIKKVDVVVTDGISMLCEPQIINKPIVFIERPDHRPFNQNGQIFSRGVHHVANIQEAREKAEFLLENDDPLLKQQQENVAKAFPIRNAAENIVEDILMNLMRE